ncbi:DENN domain and WD repeat-containing protein SCD1 [Sesamum angolense]|uniref:DENN domain and WD repeat-containing protein SCD1 n=1 Tax=Sesamum angolense TaxID=2727404 RepID=A0AAE2C5B3_9LAMI|nr:DENN domain and WD repeat-containing protein SCD1 [Sesamum angolense]
MQLKTAISRATARNDMATIRDALEVSAEMHKKDVNNVPDYLQRHFALFPSGMSYVPLLWLVYGSICWMLSVLHLLSLLNGLHSGRNLD